MAQVTYSKSGTKQSAGGFVGVDELRQGYVLHLYELLMGATTSYGDPEQGAKKFDLFCQHLRSAIIKDADRDALDNEIKKLKERMKNSKEPKYSSTDIVYSSGFLTIQSAYSFIHKVLELTVTDTTGPIGNILEIDIQDMENYHRDMDKMAKEVGHDSTVGEAILNPREFAKQNLSRMAELSSGDNESS